jgi:ubiquinone/menaquinone biosynthesis C-methylase UbiE
LEDAYSFPLEDNSVDIVVSSSCFEHADMFWLTYLEIMRILKPKGIFYLNAPTKGPHHGYPVDCWRFYPDAGKALTNWGKRNNYNNILLESYVGSFTIYSGIAVLDTSLVLASLKVLYPP